MTDTSFPLAKPLNGPDLIHTALPPTFTPFAPQRYTVPVVDGVPEDDGQINCICGYTDDDGFTVACDLCNRWQHTVCYYPHYDNTTLPDDLQHFCVECRPQPIDVEKARSKQRARREHAELLTNGTKRNASKSQKKKNHTKDAGGAPYTNGWPLDKSRHDRNSASPRDQPPPAKRPKTSHRTSDSTTITNATANNNSKGHSRKRNLSNVHQARSLSRSPDAPIGLYSEEFLQCYLDDNWEVTHANLHNSISITNSLSAWLNASEEDFKEEHGHDKPGVLMRWDGELDDIPGRANIDIRTDQDISVQYHGQHPTWKLVTVTEPIANGAYIGELKGHVGFKTEYQADISNRWAHLRHPEPFVFFHPKLPIVIDARNEGTELRYVRRSCAPNARLQILVTDGVDYHFCLMATQQIDPGVEVAVGWDTADGLPELASLATRNKVSPDEMELLSSWVSTALANCGPCACQLPESECRMSRFDRRTKDPQEDLQSTKPSKSKKRKAGLHVSPPNTHGINSRSGSEARKVDPDDEPTDSRSASGSAGRGSGSRDITPNTHYSANGSLSAMPELSERERKKLAKEEEMFRRQDEERSIKQGKKKRNSGGSNVNTPGASSSKPPLGFPPSSGATRHVDSGTHSRPAGLPPSKTAAPKRSKSRKSTPKPVIPKAVQRVRPVYVEASTQCDLDQEEATVRARSAKPQKQFISNRQRLLERAARNNSLIQLTMSRAKHFPQPSLYPDDSEIHVDPVPSPTVSSTSNATATDSDNPATGTVVPTMDTDTNMPDTTSNHDLKPSPPPDAHNEAADGANTSDKRQLEIVNPSAPPWLSKASPTPEPELESVPSNQHHRPVDMHLQMPPPSANPFAGSPTLLTGDSTGSGLAQSPASLTGPPSIFSPSVAAAITPSPARKKLSLSDYTRRKAKDKDQETKTERDSSPASTASGPVVPPLQPSNPTEARAAESGSAIEEDVKMEDVADRP